ncbi:hypothetical protein B4U80_12266 [Leptotrombidium deliense]|uniref:HMG box domain-containing protein n=1 Tax=Leptotrombidium deliense TaxID=299467 RepID=A0A443RW38_9ACAR|nr:hypothetical protein B4U80_12266 [Leptotrombidium deliense]
MKRFRKRYRKQPGLSFQRQLSKKWLRSPRLRARYRKKAQQHWSKSKKELQMLSRRRAGRKRRRPRHIPKGAQPPFFLFCLKERPKVRRQHPKWSIKRVGKELGKRWRALPEHVKEDYKKRSAKNRKAHKAMLRKYYPNG